MKVKFNTLQAIRRDFQVLVAFLEHGRGDPELHHDLHKMYKENKVSTAFQLWHSNYANRQYPSDNPNVYFTFGSRLLPYNPDFQMYPDDTNDDTLKTALLKVCDEILA